jgi:hypothetical protein
LRGLWTISLPKSMVARYNRTGDFSYRLNAGMSCVPD